MDLDRFVVGTGASAAALDGVPPASELGSWVAAGRRPDRPGIGFAAHHRDDLALLAGAGLRTMRLPLEWARLEPENGRVDGAAVEATRDVLTAARQAGVAVWATLVDGTLPGWFSHDERGFADARSRSYLWARHVEFVGETFGDLVAGWVPFHEPTRWAHDGWITGRRPPGAQADTRDFVAALEGAHLASVSAALRLREGGRPTATSQWVVPLFPARPDPASPPTAEAEAMTSVVDEVLFGSWRRLLREETLIVGRRAPVEVPGAREAFDVIGWTYRQGAAVRGDGALLPYPQTLPVGPDGRVPWSHGFGLALHRVAETFADRPVLVTGVGLRTDDEGRREEYVRDLVEITAEALEDGMDLRGLWWETPIDPPFAGAGRPGLFTADRAETPALGVLRDAAPVLAAIGTD